MKITDLLSKESVLLNADVNDKEACLVKLVDLMDASGKISDRESYLNAVHEREKRVQQELEMVLLFLMVDARALKNQVLLL